MVRLKGQKIKIIIIFKHLTATETQIRDYLTNTVWPALDIILITRMNNNFDPRWKIEKKLIVNAWTENRFEVYPRFHITGTSSLTVEQLKTAISNFLVELKTKMKTNFESQGATDVKFHIHYPDGREKETDEE